MWGFFGAVFLKWFGGMAIILILLIILVSVMGGITYDTSATDRSWRWNINIHIGDALRAIRTRIMGGSRPRTLPRPLSPIFRGGESSPELSPRYFTPDSPLLNSPFRERMRDRFKEGFNTDNWFYRRVDTFLQESIDAGS